MAVSVSRRRRGITDANKAAAVAEMGLWSTMLCGILYRIPMLLLLSIFLFIWSSSSMIMSGNFFHVCVTSRKLNDLYCLSAGSHPSFTIPLPGGGDGETGKVVEAIGSSLNAINTTTTTTTTGDGSSSNHINGQNHGDSKTSNIVKVVEEEQQSDSSVDDSIMEYYSTSSTQKKNYINDDLDSKNANSKATEEQPQLHQSNGINSDSNNSGNDDGDSKTSNTVKVVEEEQQSDSSVDDSIMEYYSTSSTQKKNHINDDLDSKNANSKATEEQLQLHQSNGINSDSNNSGNDDTEAKVAHALMVVEEELGIHRSWASDSSMMNNKNCDGRGVFVYDLPSKFNKDLLTQCGQMVSSSFCEYMENGGMGRPIPALGKGWYRTHQYSLEPIFHARVLKHRCRVYNPNEAKLFYVPYYGGLDILRWHFKNVSDDVKDALGVELVNWLGAQQAWDRNNGKDHVFVLGKISWDFRRTVDGDHWGTNFLNLEEMKNPIKLLIERQPWQLNDIGIPHPTHFHPQTDDDISAWQSKIISSPRKNLVSFAGADRADDPYNTRSILINQCTSRKDGACRFLDCKSGACSNSEKLIKLFTESEFCLQPPGDSPTRKSVFDSLVAGCIPVLFDSFTAYYQYPWHLPEEHGKYSVFVGKEELKEMNLNVVENLKDIPKKVKDDMRRFIVYELLPGLLYGDLNSQFEKFQDAFSISMNHLLNRVSRLE